MRQVGSLDVWTPTNRVLAFSGWVRSMQISIQIASVEGSEIIQWAQLVKNNISFLTRNENKHFMLPCVVLNGLFWEL